MSKCNCEHDPDVNITFGSKNPKEVCDIITPLGIVLPSLQELENHYMGIYNSGNVASSSPHYFKGYKDDPRLEFLKFKINVSYCTIESFELSIKARGSMVIVEPVKKLKSWDGSGEHEKLPCGDYAWEWDGYANLTAFSGTEPNPKYRDEYGEGVLNTKFLKREDITLHFKYKWDGGKKEGEVIKKLVYDSIASRGDWLDVSVIKNAKMVRLHMRVMAKNQINSRREVKGRGYSILHGMIQKGIEVYWRRDKNNMGFNQTAGPLHWQEGGSVLHLHDLQLKANKKDWIMHCRSEVINGEKEKWFNNTYLNVWYNQHSYAAGPGRNLSFNSKEYVTDPNGTDAHFLHTSAHEYGHHILHDAYTKDFSWGHKKTSTWGGTIDKNADQYDHWLTVCANSGLKVEFDLMRYYFASSTHFTDGLLHCKANNDDARGAIWLTKPRFTLKTVKSK